MQWAIGNERPFGAVCHSSFSAGNVHLCELGQEGLTGLLLCNLLLGDQRRLVSWRILLEQQILC